MDHEEKNKIQLTLKAMHRSILNLKRKDKFRNSTFNETLNITVI